MDNIIKYLNFEDDGLEVLDQRVEKGKRILTIQKKPVTHFCPVCSCSHIRISEGINDKDVCKLGIPLISLNETEFIRDYVFSRSVSTLPSALIDYEDELQTILHDGMIDRSW